MLPEMNDIFLVFRSFYAFYSENKNYYSVQSVNQKQVILLLIKIF